MPIYHIFRTLYGGQGEYENPMLICSTSNLSSIDYKRITLDYYHFCISEYGWKNCDEIKKCTELSDEQFDKLMEKMPYCGNYEIFRVDDGQIVNIDIKKSLYDQFYNATSKYFFTNKLKELLDSDIDSKFISPT